MSVSSRDCVGQSAGFVENSGDGWRREASGYNKLHGAGCILDVYVKFRC